MRLWPRAPRRVCSFFVGGLPLIRSSVWVSLAGGRFAPKTSLHEGWIVLGILGFSDQSRIFNGLRGSNGGTTFLAYEGAGTGARDLGTG